MLDLPIRLTGSVDLKIRLGFGDDQAVDNKPASKKRPEFNLAVDAAYSDHLGRLRAWSIRHPDAGSGEFHIRDQRDDEIAVDVKITAGAKLAGESNLTSNATAGVQMSCDVPLISSVCGASCSSTTTTSPTCSCTPPTPAARSSRSKGKLRLSSLRRGRLKKDLVSNRCEAYCCATTSTFQNQQ
jgi:hypothetical protein